MAARINALSSSAAGHSHRVSYRTLRSFHLIGALYEPLQYSLGCLKQHIRPRSFTNVSQQDFCDWGSTFPLLLSSLSEVLLGISVRYRLDAVAPQGSPTVPDQLLILSVLHRKMAPTTRSAARKAFTTSTLIPPVLETPEVLEMILLHTDIHTLLSSCQRVCRAWRNLITKSPSIQKALFFTPIKESEYGAGEKVPNSLLAEMFPTIFPTKGDPGNRDFHFSDCTMTNDPATLDRFIRKDASWRRMLVRQPPILELGLFHIDSVRGGDIAHCSTIPVSFAIYLRLGFLG